MEGQISGTPPSLSPSHAQRKRLGSGQTPKLMRNISTEQDYGPGRMGSYDNAQLRGSMQTQQESILSLHHPVVINDGDLLLASLDQAPVEDEAEATLMQVLERRQNANPQQTLTDQPQLVLTPTSGGLSSSPSRKFMFKAAAKAVIGMKHNAHDKTAHTSLGNTTSMEKNSSLPDPLTGQAPVQDSSPFQGQNLNQNQPGNLRNQLPPLTHSSIPNYAKQSNYGRHRRGQSSHPTHLSGIPAAAFLPESSQSSVSVASNNSMGLPGALTGLSTPAERARHVAITMKAANPSAALASNNLAESTSLTDEGVMPDLINILEAKRERNEDTFSKASAGSSNNNKSVRGSSIDGRSVDGNHSVGSQSIDSNAQPGKPRHRKKKPFAGVSSPFMRDQGPMSHVDQLFQVAEQVQQLVEIPEGEEFEEDPTTFAAIGSVRSKDSAYTDEFAAQNSNFLSQLFQSHPEPAPILSDEEDLENPSKSGTEAANEKTPMLQRVQTRRRQQNWYKQGYFDSNTPLGKINYWVLKFRRHMEILEDAFDTTHVSEVLWGFFRYRFLCFIVPMLAFATFTFYYLENPSSKFVPTDASDAWCILFIVRLYLTLQLAYATEYLFVDVLAMRSALSVKLIGPLATLYTIQAKGWPFIVTTWSIWNFLLLFGKKAFYYHWLFFTNIDMFTAIAPGNNIVSSDKFKEILLSMIVAGVATSIKRTVIALYLGKRVYIHYKPKLEKLMIDMLLLAEVAELASALDDFEFEKVGNPLVNEPQRSPKKSAGQARDAFRASTMQDIVQKSSTDPASDLDEDEEGDERSELDGKLSNRQSQTQCPTRWSHFRSSSTYSGDDVFANVAPKGTSQVAKTAQLSTTAEEQFSLHEDKQVERASLPDEIAVAGEDAPMLQESKAGVDALPLDYPELPATEADEFVQAILRQDTTTAHIKGLLDHWEEPVNKLDKASDPTIHEILQFRKALSFLDDTHPFSLAFGPASTRDNCIKSSKRLYKRLLNFSPGSTVLHFDVLGVLSYEQDGSFDEKKAKGLVRIFRPDKFDEVTLLAFIQSCDLVYKKLRYLRASVGNSTQIDYVLENIFNTFFNFFLALLVMSILELNPWALFMSISTIVVSFAFALGPSAAKLIEGMIMIAIRRPFDLGDQISIVSVTDKSEGGDPGFKDTWLVEDCNLFTTTLRLTRTNEACTINNGSIANTRIVNHGRSTNAFITIQLPMKIQATHDHIQIVKSALEQYISDNPRVWTRLLEFQMATIDPNRALAVYSLKAQHVKTWQEIASARGDLEKFCTEILIKLGIQYGAPANSNNIFIKEIVPNNVLSGGLLPTSQTEIPSNK